MKHTSLESPATETDKEILREIAAHNKKGIRRVISQNPEYAEKLKHLPYHVLVYWITKFRKELSGEKRIQKNQRKESIKKVDIDSINTNGIQQNGIYAQHNSQDHVNFCPSCGRNLFNIRQTMLLENAGKI